MIGLKSYLCSGSYHDWDDFDDQDYLEDGIDDYISTPKEKEYNDDEYDY